MGDIADPYAPPSAELRRTGSAEERAEAVREELLTHETSLRSVGLLYYLGGVMLLIGGIAMLATAYEAARGSFVATFVYAALGVLALGIGWGVRRLKAWAKVPLAILSVIGLLGFPIGTLINGYILYLVFSKKGKRVFSPEYAEVMALTPHVKYRTSVIVWILLGLVVVGILAAILIPAFA